jgi:hypothetical protein
VEKCFVYDDDVVHLRDKEMCAAVTFQSIEKHLDEGHIHFSFLIKKNGKESFEMKTPPVSEKKGAMPVKPKTLALSKKGILKSNNVRKESSIPDLKLPSPSGASVDAKKDVELGIDVLKNSTAKQNLQPPEYSSINKHETEKCFKSPAHCTLAINKSNDVLVSKFRSLFSLFLHSFIYFTDQLS